MTPKKAFKRIESVIELADDSANNYTATGRELEEAIIRINDDMKLVRKALTELEELKQRDTPMKVKVNEILTKGAEHKRYTCPSCDYFFGYICTTTTECNVLRDNFCHHCGQRLDWSDDK